VSLARVGLGGSPIPPRDDPDGAAQREPVYQP
jgi:hypothetical protein